ncbi:syntaxin-19-like [Sceloporus undulatus]|uniref:syntaxin-19-like n=1 Tax=Sceloporus undulatus TaxID=8520 RepID=UPI001C4C111D|nr:syntaxin-19-like [Sceloporus undulatus]XP_042298923.1 syntaxin-19-like [Sceloporus undulatus]
MKDRLQEFKLKAKQLQLLEESSCVSGVVAEEQGELEQTAVIFEKEPVTERYLNEIQRLHNDINNLATDVQKFSQQQKSLVASMRRFSVLKKECSATREIKIQAEHISMGLDDLSKTVKKVEKEYGSSSAVGRVLSSQRAVLFRRFQNIMFLYNGAITAKQEKCKGFIVRQLEVAGKQVSEEELNDMVQQGKWEIFNENLLTEVKITKAQLSEIEQRHKELVNLENQVKDLKGLFIQISLLVEEQGEMINNIEMEVTNTQDYVQASREKFRLAAKYRKRNPCRALCCCCCCPCSK